MPFHGFSDPALADVDGRDLYAVSLYVAEAGELLELISKKLGGRVQSARRVQGHDTRTGRDYFFDNLEVRRRSDPGSPCFVGVYHYRLPETRKGSHFEAWRTAHDDAPAFTLPLATLVAAAGEAFRAGRSPQWLDDLADEVRQALGL